MGLINLNLEVPEHLIEAAKNIAKIKHISLDEAINDALEMFLKKSENNLSAGGRMGLINPRRITRTITITEIVEVA